MSDIREYKIYIEIILFPLSFIYESQFTNTKSSINTFHNTSKRSALKSFRSNDARFSRTVEQHRFHSFEGKKFSPFRHWCESPLSFDNFDLVSIRRHTHIYIYTYIRATIKLQSVQRHVTWNAPRTAFFHRAPLFWHPSLPSPPSSAPTVATEQTWLAPWRKLINTKRRRDVLFSSFNVKSRQGRVTVHPRYSSYTSLRDALQRDKRFPPLFTVSFYRLFFLRVSPLLAKRSIERRNFITLLEDDVA